MKKIALGLSFLFTTAVTFAQVAEPGVSGFGLLNAKTPSEDVLFGGQPDSGQIEAMARAGFRTVLDLRREEEPRGFDEARLVADAGLEYLALPVGSDTLQDPVTFERFFELYREAERPLLVHCASGNRVGALYYAYLVAEQGLEREEALDQARQQGLRSDALVVVVDQFLDSRPQP